MSYGSNHPSTKIKGTYSQKLQGKTILMGITGSVAAYLSPKIARELIRHGADIIPVMSNDGLNLIGKDLMWWATGHEPITTITGDLEHIRVAGVMNPVVDMMLIAPCTTNTLGKLATGIADTSVTLIASTLAGKGVPLLLLPVAHEDLINSPAISFAMEQVENFGYEILAPKREEGKAKVPDIEDIVFEVINQLSEKKLDTRVIITGGPTREYLDNVRYITNASSGKTAIALASEARFLGADVTLVLGPTNEFVPEAIDTLHVISSQEMADSVISLLDKEPESIVILSSAMADFTPKKRIKGKIKSGNELIVELTNTIKLSDQIKTKYPNSTLVLFKAEWDVTSEELINRARNKMEHCRADAIVANDLSKPGSGFQTITNHVYIMYSDKVMELESLKTELSEKLFSLIVDGLISRNSSA
ncbi:MAG: bifunctional phosphopantothenoylcysteine decarboxylase/phosphopantothenate--cysteine ligase CoaBC [Candidatus Heimdallarchaeota archaeon]|nr:bifunctional phosphopantothenoylcysteine decarboxylase/phosphopantothenate--cysteine ligase CoaBC [Candidatus Heimdallarchaeota archaeon]